MVGLNPMALRRRNHHPGTLYSCVPSRGAATAAPCTPCVFHDPARLDGFFL